ncbi:hypothetical protein [Geoalkalibacter halelectricus]|uniref:hypothetical protein n=1 Tax=Geoalkalibacter halelectricus TaxID=2847045 RepID=UPI003D195DBE
MRWCASIAASLLLAVVLPAWASDYPIAAAGANPAPSYPGFASKGSSPAPLPPEFQRAAEPGDYPNFDAAEKANAKTKASTASSAAAAAFGTRAGLNANAAAPLTSGTSPLSTLDGQIFGSAQISVASSHTFLSLFAQPGASGDIQTLVVSQDLDMDGAVDFNYTPGFAVSGVCANGFVSCAPGTWEGCTHYAWVVDEGKINVQPVGPGVLGGCYCINNSCGGTDLVWNNLSMILNDLGGGAAGAVTQASPSYQITQARVDAGNMAIHFYGQDTRRVSQADAGLDTLLDSASQATHYFKNPGGLQIDGQSAAMIELNKPTSLYHTVTAHAHSSVGESDRRNCSQTRTIVINEVNAPCAAPLPPNYLGPVVAVPAEYYPVSYQGNGVSRAGFFTLEVVGSTLRLSSLNNDWEHGWNSVGSWVTLGAAGTSSAYSYGGSVRIEVSGSRLRAGRQSYDSEGGGSYLSWGSWVELGKSGVSVPGGYYWAIRLEVSGSRVRIGQDNYDEGAGSSTSWGQWITLTPYCPGGEAPSDGICITQHAACNYDVWEEVISDTCFAYEQDRDCRLEKEVVDQVTTFNFFNPTGLSPLPSSQEFRGSHHHKNEVVWQSGNLGTTLSAVRNLSLNDLARGDSLVFSIVKTAHSTSSGCQHTVVRLSVRTEDGTVLYEHQEGGAVTLCWNIGAPYLSYSYTVPSDGTHSFTLVGGGYDPGKHSLNSKFSARLVRNIQRGDTFVRPWWEKERTYSCQGNPPFDLSDISERVRVVEESTDGLELGATNLVYEDLRRASSGNSWISETNSITLPAPEKFESCQSVCKTRRIVNNTDLTVGSTSDQLRSDAVSATLAANQVWSYAYRQCFDAGCPLQPGEQLVKDCQCVDDFAEATAIMETMSKASKDIICSGGVKH